MLYPKSHAVNPDSLLLSSPPFQPSVHQLLQCNGVKFNSLRHDGAGVERNLDPETAVLLSAGAQQGFTA